VGGENWGTATLPLHRAAEEAWMSINPFHRIAARLRMLPNLKGRVVAARGERGRQGKFIE